MSDWTPPKTLERNGQTWYFEQYYDFDQNYCYCNERELGADASYVGFTESELKMLDGTIQQQLVECEVELGQTRLFASEKIAEKDKRIAELEPLAKCALELRKWFLDNEFWNDENSEDIFPILEKHGLVECVEYDPAIHNCDNNEPGDTIWYFPPLAGESV